MKSVVAIGRIYVIRGAYFFVSQKIVVILMLSEREKGRTSEVEANSHRQRSEVKADSHGRWNCLYVYD